MTKWWAEVLYSFLLFWVLNTTIICGIHFQQVKVTLNDEDMDTFVFAVGTKKAMARMQKEMQDLVKYYYNFFSSIFIFWLLK